MAASVYTIRSLGNAFRSFLIAPLVNLNQVMLESEERSRKFEYAISGIVGYGRARQINRQMVRASRDLPFSVEDVRESARALAALPGTASTLNQGSAADAAARAIQFGNTARRLAVLDPQQGNQGALIALRDVLEGGGGDSFVSLRRRFGLTARQIARAAGASLDDVRNDPSLALRGVSKLIDVLIPDSALARGNNLISIKVEKIKDALTDALVQAQDSGVFDSTAKRLDNLGKIIFGYLDSSEFKSTASRVSRSLDQIIGNVSKSLDRFLRAASGTKNDNSTVAGIASSLSGAIDRLAKLSDNLPDALGKLGNVAGVVGDRINDFIDAVILIADAARDPARMLKAWVGGHSLPALSPVNHQMSVVT